MRWVVDRKAGVAPIRQEKGDDPQLDLKSVMLYSRLIEDNQNKVKTKLSARHMWGCRNFFGMA